MSEGSKSARDVIVAVMHEVAGVAKHDKNTQQGFNFRGIDAVVNAIGPALRKAGGFIVPEVLDREYEVVASRNGGSLNVVRLVVQFQIYGAQGDPIKGTVAAEAFDSGDKATAKAMSVAFRTFMLQVFALPTDERDPDADSYEIVQSQPDTQVDYKGQIAKLVKAKDKVGLRELYVLATKAKAPNAVLELIKESAEQL